jgi:hypothetical protein
MAPAKAGMKAKTPPSQDDQLGGRNETGLKIRSALESTGAEFIGENGGGPGGTAEKATAEAKAVT